MKLLIISNNPISKANSNGRTMLEMLKHFNRDEVLNIFINGDNPSIDRALFYKIDEPSMLRRPLSKKHGFFIEEQTGSLETVQKRRKTAFKCLLRSIIWKNQIVYREIKNVVLNFSPDALLVQCGDSDFLINISVKLSRQLGLSLFAFNSEDYIFKKWNYLERKFKRSLCFRLFQKNLERAYSRLYVFGQTFIYLTEGLKECYLNKYPLHKSCVIYNSSSVIPGHFDLLNYDVIYSGNVSVGREKTLLSLSKKIYDELGKKTIVYSNSNDEGIIKLLSRCESIDYRGSISYDDNIKQITKSSLLIHIESFDNYYINDSKNAFSTKIADSLSSGMPFLVYAPKSCFVVRYLNENNCALTASSDDELMNILKYFKDGDRIISETIQKSLSVARTNHNSEKNSDTFFNTIQEGIYYNGRN